MKSFRLEFTDSFHGRGVVLWSLVSFSDEEREEARKKRRKAGERKKGLFEVFLIREMTGILLVFF